MRRSISILFALAVVLNAAPLAAQTPQDAVVTVVDQGYYLGPGVRIDEDRVSDLVAEAANTGALLSIVVLVDDPAGGATSFATGVLTRLGAGTVLVLTETGSVGYDTVEFDRSVVEAALDRADQIGGSDIDYLTTIVSELTGAPVAVPTPVATTVPAPTTAVSQAAETSTEGGGGSGLLIFLVILVGGGLFVWFLMRRSRKAASARAQGDMASARKEIQAQLDTMANDILAMSDRVSVVGDDRAQAYFEAGSQTYAQATDELEGVKNVAQLEG
ncbi:MAG: hypothetical protein OEM22_05305, partial [Acidimicrobiia bacterium]|nr:hypothetical protein [Acidimicrobiia bacterium]